MPTNVTLIDKLGGRFNGTKQMGCIMNKYSEITLKRLSKLPKTDYGEYLNATEYTIITGVDNHTDDCNCPYCLVDHYYD